MALSGAERAGVQRLQTHAAETQAPLVEFAGRRFRLTDAVLVTVNTGRLSLDTRADIEGAEVEKTGLVTTDTGTARGGHIQIVGPGTGFGQLTDGFGTALSGSTVSTSASTGSYDTTHGLTQRTVIVVRGVYGTQ